MIAGITLRKWQEKGYYKFEKFLHEGKEQLYVFSCVGSGKTMFSAVCATVAYKRGQFNKIIIVCPQWRVKKQWALTFQRFGIRINYKWNGGGLKGFDGISMTYDGTVAALEDLIKLTDESTLVIVDEIHHTSTEITEGANAWGKAVSAAFNHVGFRVVLTGTPFRYTKEKILFTPYVEDEEGKFWVKPDVEYTYGQAVEDRVNRPTKFHFFGGEVTLQKGKRVFTLPFSELTSEHIQRQALKGALDLNGDWVREIIDAFYTDIYSLSPVDAFLPAGLVICKDQTEARKVQIMFKEWYGEDAVLVISDLANDGIDPQQVLNKFETSFARILISVGMVSEGVDLPRLTHCLYLSNILSPVFIWQVLGRIVRTMNPRLVDVAKMYLPELPILVEICGNIEQNMLGVAEEKPFDTEEEEEELLQEDQVEEGKVRLPSIISLSSSGEHSFTIYKGVMYSPDEMKVIQSLIDAGLNEIREEELKHIMSVKATQTAYIDTSFTNDMTGVEEMEVVRNQIKQAVGALNAATHMGHRKIHKQANDYLAKLYKVKKLSTADMTLNQLKKKLKLLNKKLGKLNRPVIS